ncbi:hypothetical protein Bbelb_186330 [Branchiostoma belcheri]|nr:hypothetical protein Bbelb_186330 [Branchiostoma belcheri]
MLAVVSKVLSLITDLHGDLTDSYSSESETESSASDDTDIASAIGTAASAAKRRNGKEVLLEWNFSGVVTQFSHNCGLVDDTVYFSRGVVQGSEVTAKRSSLTAGWRAEVVTLITSADWEDEEGGITDPTVGTVTDVTESAIVIDYLHTVNMEGAVHHGYRPWKGDWVKAETSENGTVHLEPLRSQILTGKVSQVRGDTGVVDSEVVFWPQVCEDGYVPSRGDWVEVTAIESTQGHYNWRATSVTPVRRPTRDRYLTSEGFNSAIIQPNDLKFGMEVEFKLRRGAVLCPKPCLVPNHAWARFGTHDACPKPCLTFWDTRGLSRTVPDRAQFWTHKGLVPFRALGVELIVLREEPSRALPGTVLDSQAVSRSVPAQARNGTGTVWDTTGSQDLCPSKLKSWQTQKVQDGWVIPGQSPFRRKPVRFPVHLPQYPVPDMLRNCVFEGGEVMKIMPALCKLGFLEW